MSGRRLGDAAAVPGLGSRPACGSARVVTSFGPLVAGLMVGAFGGSFNKVTAVMTCCAVFNIIAMILGRETKGAGLPR